ncbi:MAG: hypothetical protein N2V78_09240 [Methanophagales archaeon]|nr:hypothetical protein [Methanophagales archaeon]
MVEIELIKRNGLLHYVTLQPLTFDAVWNVFRNIQNEKSQMHNMEYIMQELDYTRAVVHGAILFLRKINALRQEKGKRGSILLTARKITREELKRKYESFGGAC